MTVGRVRVVAGVTGALALAGIVLAALGFPLWLLAGVVWWTATLLLARHLGWLVSFAGSAATILAIETWYLRLTPLLGVDLVLSHLVAWGALEAGLLTLLIARSHRVRFPDRRALRTALAALVAPALALLAAAVTALVTGGSRISWAMNNDAAWTTVVARHIWADDGIDTTAHINSSPFTAALLALAFGPGHEAAAPAAVLRHDVVREAQLWIVVIAITQLLLGLLVARALARRSILVQFGTAAVVGFLPWSWYVSGLGFEFGFYSAAVAFLLIVLAWTIAADSAAPPVIVVAFLAALTTALLGTWGPLITIPMALAVSVVLRDPRAFRPRRTIATAILGVALVQGAAYVILITIPDVRIDGQALGATGAVPAISMASVAVCFGALVVLAASQAAAGGARETLPPVLALTAGTAAGLAVLLWQSRAAASPWSYYPVKFAWIATGLAIVALVVLLVRLTFGGPARSRSILVAVGGAALVVGLLGEGSPVRVSLTALSPAVDIWRGTGVSASDRLAELLFRFSDPEQKNLLVKYDATPGGDHYVNFWLLQQPTQAGDDPLRFLAYGLDETDPAQVCDAVDEWGPGVTIRTRDDGLTRALAEHCPELSEDYRVVVEG